MVSVITARQRKPILTRLPDPEVLEQAIWRSVNAWDIARRSRGGMFGRRIHRTDAERELKRALAVFEKENGHG